MSASKPSERTLTVSAALDGNGLLLLSIADRGNGIPSDAADLLFEPFFTTKPHGLGRRSAARSSLPMAAVFGQKTTSTAMRRSPSRCRRNRRATPDQPGPNGVRDR
jgi:phosphoglycerate-specific signal transduction histidine kinase